MFWHQHLFGELTPPDLLLSPLSLLCHRRVSLLLKHWGWSEITPYKHPVPENLPWCQNCCPSSCRWVWHYYTMHVHRQWLYLLISARHERLFCVDISACTHFYLACASTSFFGNSTLQFSNNEVTAGQVTTDITMKEVETDNILQLCLMVSAQKLPHVFWCLVTMLLLLLFSYFLLLTTIRYWWFAQKMFGVIFYRSLHVLILITSVNNRQHFITHYHMLWLYYTVWTHSSFILQ